MRPCERSPTPFFHRSRTCSTSPHDSLTHANVEISTARRENVPDLDVEAFYARFGSRSLGSTESKHVPQSVESPLIDELIELARAMGYANPKMGAHQGMNAHEDRQYVRALVERTELRPLKFVLTRDGRVWADNTHWTLAAVLKHGLDQTIADVPHYFVDFTDPRALVINRPESLLGLRFDDAVRKAGWIQERLDLGWRPPTVSFTIEDLLESGGYREP